MNGHRELIAMRRSGFRPECVWVADYPCPTDWAKWGDHPQVCVDGDTPELEDFRFLVGITVVIDGFDNTRVQRFAKACSTHAKRVIANVSRITEPYQRIELVSTTDTAGVLTWPQ